MDHQKVNVSKIAWMTYYIDDDRYIQYTHTHIHTYIHTYIILCSMMGPTSTIARVQKRIPTNFSQNNNLTFFIDRFCIGLKNIHTHLLIKEYIQQ